MKNVVFWDVTPCGACRNLSPPSSGGQEFSHSLLQLLVTANVVPSSPIIVTLMMKTIRSFYISVLTRATRRNIPGDGILQGIFLLAQVNVQLYGSRGHRTELGISSAIEFMTS
jgi:hypothetical protein